MAVAEVERKSQQMARREGKTVEGVQFPPPPSLFTDIGIEEEFKQIVDLWLLV